MKSERITSSVLVRPTAALAVVLLLATAAGVSGDVGADHNDSSSSHSSSHSDNATVTPSSTVTVVNVSTDAPTLWNRLQLQALSQLSDPNRISIKDIQVLTFKEGRLASRQRTTAPPQLKCMSGCFGELPKSVQCKNVGWDGLSVNWRCEASLQRGRRLENTRVRCESLPEGDTEHVLKGSCALEYTLGGQPGPSGGGGKRPVRPGLPSGGSSHRTNPLQYIVPVIMIAVVVVICCALFKACARNRESSGVVIGPPPGQPMGPGQAPGFYGGANAYPAQPGFNPGYAQPSYGAPMMAPQSGGGGRSGLGPVGAGLGGLAAGGVLGYMMGNRGSDHHHHYDSSGGNYGAYGTNGGGGDYGGDMGGGGGYEMSTDFADTAME